MKGLVPIREGLLDRLNDFLHSSEGNLFSTRDRLLGWDVTAAPRTLDRATPAYQEVIDGRFQRIHPEILLLRNTLHIEGLSNITNVGRVIFQQRKMIEGETVQILLRSNIGKGVDENSSLSSPSEIRDREEILLPLENGMGQF